MRGGTRVSYSMGFSGLDQKWGDMDMVLRLQNMVLRGFTRQYLRVKPDLRMKQIVQKEYQPKRPQPRFHQHRKSWLGREMTRKYS